jgi:hypothetical protein
MIQFEDMSYVIVQVNNKRNLVKVLKCEDESFTGVYERHRIQESPEEVQFQYEDVVANLGTDPVFGSVYGCSTEIYRKKKKLDGWGSVVFYRDISKEELKVLRQSLLEVTAEIRATGIELHPFDTDIKEARGRYDGFYKFRPKKVDGVSTDLITLKPKTFDNLKPLLHHEIGHSVWYRRLPADIHAKWILAYHKAIELQSVSKTEIDEIIDDFVASNTMCKDFKHTLNERQVMIFDNCLDFVDAKHMLNVHHLDTLILSNHNISAYFNVDDVKLSDMRLILTEYAQESPEEFFAEAFRLQMTGAILPKSLRDLMIKSLKKAVYYSADDDE